MKRLLIALMVISLVGCKSAEDSTDGFILIKAGTFTMGSPESELGRDDAEAQHQVTLTSGFYISDHEVTQAEWEALIGNNPSQKNNGTCPTCPVERVNWHDAIAYANALSDKDGFTRCYSGSGDNIRWDESCKGYRLPTEAEWEYAARAGHSTKYAGSNSPPAVAWYRDNSGRKTHPGAEKKANAWGIYDMTGNVHEWVWDWRNPSSGNVTDPKGPSSGAINVSRIIRGGSWFATVSYMRVASRNTNTPDYRGDDTGFRLVRTAK